METLEVHSKDFLIKWVNVPENGIVDWQIKPLRRSINFSIYKKNDFSEENSTVVGGPATSTANGGNSLAVDGRYKERNNSNTSISSTGPGTGRVRSSSVTSVNRITEPFHKTKSRTSTLSSNISSGDLSLVKDYGKLLSNELVHGKLDVSSAGVYAFIFDNSFSKTTGKKILFSTKIVSRDVSVKFRPSDYPSPVTPPTQPSSTSQEDLTEALKQFPTTTTKNIMRPKNGELLQGILLKKRRKKLQGFVKRYFVLNIKYATLSYFRVNDNKLRGQMPINQSIISANVKKLELIVDSGMEVWDLKALNKEDFDVWVGTFNRLKKLYYKDDVNATFHREVQMDDGIHDQANSLSNTPGNSLPSYLLDDLNSINANVKKLAATRQGDELVAAKLKNVSDDINALISKLSGTTTNRNSLTLDAMSLFSSDYYDAKEYIDASNGGVVQLEDDDLYDDDFSDAPYEEEEDDDGASSTGSSSSSSGDSMKSLPNDLSIIAETESRQSQVAKAGGVDYDKTLYPLPLDPVERSVVVPIWTHPPSSILSFFRKNVGKDLTSIAMPVDMNEPVTILQKYAELIEYCDLINNALEVDDSEKSGEKLLRIAAFAVSYLSSVRDKERNVRKPFNPLLGETFELVREDKGIRLISEKVSHRPPVFATFVESKDWTLSYSLSPSQKFWGKTAEIHNKGSIKLTIKSTGEVFHWSQPTSILQNIIAGEKYSEPKGTMTIKSSTGAKAVVEFAKGGMFSGRSEEVVIEAFEGRNKLPYSVFGKWTESLTLKTKTTEKLIWTVGKLLPDSKKRFGFTEFANELIQITDIEKGVLSPTDSRLRPDVKAYLSEDLDKAEALKCEMEENQRVRRKEMEQANKKHEPLFFHHVGDTNSPDSGEWVYAKGEKSYWNRRANQDWDGLLELW